MIEIRQESKNDFQEVDEVIRTAFAEVAMSDQTESELVKRLRNSSAFIPELSLVAIVGNRIVGQILLTLIQIVNEKRAYNLLALAPVSVRPDYQSSGIGRALITESHKRALHLGYEAIALIGHSQYYPKFGYVPASNFGIHFPIEAPDENCMVVELKDGVLSDKAGMIRYSKEFLV